MTKIYILVDPRNHEIRYVGKTTQPGMEVSEEIRQRQSDRMTGVPMDPSVKSKISAALKGRSPIKAQCQRWNINRGKPCVCGQHKPTD